MRKLMSLVLALVLTFALAVPAGAAETKPAPASKEVGVIVNGKVVDFPANAQPEVIDGYTMAPLKIMVEAMGGKVTAVKDGKFTCNFYDEAFSSIKEIQFDLGKDCYTKGGYTYMMVSNLGGILGYDVMWDKTTRSAVMVYRHGLTNWIDNQCGILYDALDKIQRDPTQNYKSTITYDISMDFPADGVTPAMQMTLKMKLNLISNANAVEINGSVDATSLLKLLEVDKAVGTGAMTKEEAAAVTKVLSNLTFQIRFDMRTMTYYMNMPVFSLLSEGQIPAETWLKLSMDDIFGLAGRSGVGSVPGMGQWFSLGEMDAEDLADMRPTLGGMVYALCRADAKSSGELSTLYSDVQTAGQRVIALLGDAAAKPNGSGSIFRFGKAELDKLAGEAVADELFETFSIVLTTGGDGIGCTFDIKPTHDTGDDALSFSGKMTMSVDKALLDMTMNMGALGKAKYVMNITMIPTTQKPVATPPTGAKVMTPEELFSSLYAQAQTQAEALAQAEAQAKPPVPAPAA